MGTVNTCGVSAQVKKRHITGDHRTPDACAFTKWEERVLRREASMTETHRNSSEEGLSRILIGLDAGAPT